MVNGSWFLPCADTELSSVVDALGADCGELVLLTLTDVYFELDDPVVECWKLLASADTELPPDALGICNCERDILEMFDSRIEFDVLVARGEGLIFALVELVSCNELEALSV